MAIFTRGSNDEPTCNEDAVTTGLGEEWEINNICIKPYPAMGGLHASIDCIRLLQSQHAGVLSDVRKIKGIKIEMGEEAYSYSGWEIEKRPLEVVGAQMSAKYVVAAQLVDGTLLPASYGPSKIDRSDFYDLIDKTKCVHQKAFDRSQKIRIGISFDTIDKDIEIQVDTPKGVQPAMTNKEVWEKYEGLTKGLVDEDRAKKIQRFVLDIKDLKKVEELVAELRQKMECGLK